MLLSLISLSDEDIDFVTTVVREWCRSRKRASMRVDAAYRANWIGVHRSSEFVVSLCAKAGPFLHPAPACRKSPGGVGAGPVSFSAQLYFAFGLAVEHARDRCSREAGSRA